MNVFENFKPSDSADKASQQTRKKSINDLQISSSISKVLTFEDDSPCRSTASDISNPSFKKLFLQHGRKIQSDNHDQKLHKNEFSPNLMPFDISLKRGGSKDSLTKPPLAFDEFLGPKNLLKELQINDSPPKPGSYKNSPHQTDGKIKRKSQDQMTWIPLQDFSNLGTTDKIQSIEEEEDGDFGCEEFEISFARKVSISSNHKSVPNFERISAQETSKYLEDSAAHYLIVDCRFGYEYNGGHIKGALNITSSETLEKIFFEHKTLLYNPQYVSDLKTNMTETLSKLEHYYALPDDARKEELPMIIFHCEFSQKRGPRAYTTLRNRDREKNRHNYPQVDYKNIMVLEKGYREFFKLFPNHCEGGFVKMLDKSYEKEYQAALEDDRNAWNKIQSMNLDKNNAISANN